MIIGVTGTRTGMTGEQQQSFLDFFRDDPDGFDVRQHELHHGDCVGVDYEMAVLAVELCWRTVSHPPVKDKFRAFHQSDVILPVRGYLERDRNIRNIVDFCDVLYAFPRDSKADLLSPYQEGEGGTVYTLKYAIKTGRSLVVIYPSGKHVDLRVWPYDSVS